MKQGYSNWLAVSIMGCCVTAGYCQSAPNTSDNEGKAAPQTKQAVKADSKQMTAAQTQTAAGTAKIWEDRGALTPVQVFWGGGKPGAKPCVSPARAPVFQL